MITILHDFDLRARNTFRIPARTACWIEFTHRDDIPAVAARMAEAGKHAYVIGEGSDLLFTRPEIDAVIVHSAILSMDVTPLGDGRVRIVAGSGIRMDDLVVRTAQSGLWGMENLSLIPGEVGASAVQNVGAYGVEAADIIECLDAYDVIDRRFVTLTAADCGFAYRHSVFKTPEAKGRYIIASVTFILSSRPAPKLGYGNLAGHLEGVKELTPMAVREAVSEIRRMKLPDPEETGSAGSYFTNPQVTADDFERVVAVAGEFLAPGETVPHFILPDGRVKIPAAWLIDRAGLKGLRVGGAGLWPSQPLVIANLSGSATAADVMAVEQRVVTAVKDRFGIILTPEVEKIPPTP